MQATRLACHAMATRFELLLHGEDVVRLRAAGEEALAEIERIEAQMSFYRPTSELSRINARAASGPVRVEAGLFHLLVRAKLISEATGGAFDVTVGPLMRCWGFVGGTGAMPEPGALEEARARVGMHLVELDEANLTVRYLRPGVQIDLGAIGKGYAMEQAVVILQELGIASALLHGGTSTVHALGQPPGGDRWKVAIDRPDAPGGEGEPQPLAVVPLEDQALSVSAVWGKAFALDGRVYGHVLDPRVGRPVERAALAAVVGVSATETDALSTALLTLGVEEHACVTAGRGEMPVLVLEYGPDSDDLRVLTRGIAVQPSPRLQVVELPA
jgi:FAD:protein FMN transferase